MDDGDRITWAFVRCAEICRDYSCRSSADRMWYIGHIYIIWLSTESCKAMPSQRLPETWISRYFLRSSVKFGWVVQCVSTLRVVLSWCFQVWATSHFVSCLWSLAENLAKNRRRNSSHSSWTWPRFHSYHRTEDIVLGQCESKGCQRLGDQCNHRDLHGASTWEHFYTNDKSYPFVLYMFGYVRIFFELKSWSSTSKIHELQSTTIARYCQCWNDFQR